MLSREIRQKFLHYFKKNGHAIVPSSSTLPHDDPTLLFTNAGMNQFKDVFLGKAKRSYKRATTAQKCIRVGGKHNDLDNVGHTSRHMTFFEMLGNFSFGDYSKKEAIRYAWEVSMEIFQFDKDKIWPSVFEKDDESFELWKEYLTEDRIVRFGESENFWTMGETGPCGPCTELLFDRGPSFGSASSPLEDKSGERYIEYWNLVFMQFDRQPSGKLLPLPKIAVDTGAGFERILSLMTGTANVFQTDILRHLIDATEALSKATYHPDHPKLAAPFHVIADHLRALSFAIADGAQPGNTEEGYVLRKILRRAVRYGRLLNIEEPFLARLFPSLIEVMGEDYPELSEGKERICEILTLEEENFDRTLKRGGNILTKIIDKAKSSGRDQMSGADAFKLKDTYGFPIEEILLIAKDAGMSVNLDAYQLLEEKAKETSRRAGKTQEHRKECTADFESFLAKHGASQFIGYDQAAAEATITGLLVEGKWVETMTENQQGTIILDQTPFYAEKGGQVGDTGEISHHKARFTVTDCHTPYSRVIAHVGTLKTGTLMVGEPIKAAINAERRNAIARHHTATHLLHFALTEILGPHIKQAGSLVNTDRLRFDFTHHKGVSPSTLRDIERLINQKVRENTPVTTCECALEEVQKQGDVKQFFGDKYDDIVRLVAVGTYSKELCGGTHVSRSGSVGLFRIVKEGSIGQGIRRIEAVTGVLAEKVCYHFEDDLLYIAKKLKANATTVMTAFEHKLAEHEELISQITAMKQESLKHLVHTLHSQVKKIGELSLVTALVNIERKELPFVADSLLEMLPSGVVCLATSDGEKCHLFLKLSSSSIKLGFHANQLIKEISPLVQGSGGGKKETAQAGGKYPEGVTQAFEKIESLLEKSMEQEC